MVKVSKALLRCAGSGINKTLLEILVCPLSKQPLRFCEESNSLVNDNLGISYPIVNGIPCLIPKDAKLLETDDALKPGGSADSSVINNEYSK